MKKAKRQHLRNRKDDKKNAVNFSLVYISHENEAINCLTEIFIEAKLDYGRLLFSVNGISAVGVVAVAIVKEATRLG